MFKKNFATIGKMAIIAGVIGAMLLPTGVTQALQSEIIHFRGSTTVFPVVEVAATRFPASYPDAALTWQDISGSSFGCNCAAAGTCDLGMASSTCSQSGISPTVFARDALSIVVHPSKAGCISNITRVQLVDIYEGEINNWSQLGCPAAPLVPRARVTTSGSRTSFLDMLKSVGSALTAAEEEATITATGLPRLEGNEDVHDAIAANPNQIGYVGLAFTSTGVHTLSVDGVFPSDDTVNNGTYKMGRNLHYYRNNNNTRQRVTDYLTWSMGAEAQAIVKRVGYIAIIPSSQIAPDWDINLDKVGNISDIAAIGLKWGQTSSVHGFVRADSNWDGNVNISDVAYVGLNWGATW